MKRKKGVEKSNEEQYKKIKTEPELERLYYKKHHDRWRLEKSQIGRRNFP